MSRETDTPSSGPNGRGGAAYPSGTPPYGTPKVSDAGADAGRSGTQSDDRKTETTLTTRIRINIPGSRPIPPVVVRKPVADADGSATADDDGYDPAASPAATPSSTAASAPAEPAPPAREKPASDWFAPRKSSGPKALPGGSGGNGAGLAAGPGAGPTGQTGPGGAAGTGGGARPGGVVGSMNMPGAVRGGVPTSGTGGLPGATGGPVAPGHGGGTGSFDVTEALSAGTRSGGAPRPGQGGATPDGRRDDLPYFSETADGGPGSAGFDGYDGFPPSGGPGGLGGPGGSGGFSGPGGGAGGPGRPQGPAGPTGGPVTGTGPLIPPVGQNATGHNGIGHNGVGRAAIGQNGVGAAGRTAPAGRADDTAELTPQPPAGGPGIQGFEGFDSFGSPSDNVSGHTVTSGIPVVPPGASSSPFGPGPRRTPPRLPEPPAQNTPGGQGNQAGQSPQSGGQSAAPTGKKAKKAKKGRSKLVLLGGVVVLAGCGVYGAGLLMNHSDVPKGTTVLGVDIGGGTRDDAVKKLDDAFGSRVNQPLKLSVGGKTVSLTPDKAGLQLDADATVAAAAKSDYNPVSVVGSLFGQQRAVDPVMPVDEEKLEAALRAGSGGSGSVVEGSIKFESGKAVAVYGKAGKGIDAAASTQAVAAAYRTMVETGTATPVTVPTTTQQPTVSNAEVDREMKDFAKPAMSGLVTVQTDAAHSIPFGPVSLPKILGVKAVSGKLVETYDLDALKAAYGTTFDGVQIQTATGKRGILPQDVVSALRTALRGTTAAQRVGVIDTSPN
ncbi:hypothetical protein [Streptomyces sp. NPDC047000]|uniref:hypothetical protein n=1 Tax=Streptomyces sp. NPDC047000 TaxID=3155474 RepID=UPI00340D7CF8